MAPCITSRTQWLSDAFSCSFASCSFDNIKLEFRSIMTYGGTQIWSRMHGGTIQISFQPNSGPNFSKGQPLLVWNTELRTGEATSKQARWVGCQAHTQIKAHKRLPLLWIASCSEKLQCPLGWKFHLAKVEMEGIQHLPWRRQAKEGMGYAGQISTDTSSVGMEQTESKQV